MKKIENNKALESTATTETSIEAKKADIERRRQADLEIRRRGARAIKSTPKEVYKRVIDSINAKYDAELIEYTYCQVTISNINQGKIWIQDNSP